MGYLMLLLLWGNEEHLVCDLCFCVCNVLIFGFLRMVWLGLVLPIQRPLSLYDWFHVSVTNTSYPIVLKWAKRSNVIASDYDSKYRYCLLKTATQNIYIYGLLQMFKSDCPSSESQKRYGFQPSNANVSSSILERVMYFLKELMCALINDLASVMIGGCSFYYCA